MSNVNLVKLIGSPVQIAVNVTPKGAFDEATAYGMGDSVSYLGSSYVAITATVGNLPTDSIYWQLLAAKGDAGAASLGIRNVSGTTILARKAVYINGASGNMATISLASAANELTSERTIGITTSDIPHNSNGNVIQIGELSGFDTTGFLEGSDVWLSTIAGEITPIRPIAPNHSVFVGFVTRVHATQGTIFLNIQNGFELDEMHDVLISSPLANQKLNYNGMVWENKTTEYNYTQAIASNIWTINHNLGFKPNVSIFSIGGSEIIAEIVHISNNQVIIYLNTSLAGTARLL